MEKIEGGKGDKPLEGGDKFGRRRKKKFVARKITEKPATGGPNNLGSNWQKREPSRGGKEKEALPRKLGKKLAGFPVVVGKMAGSVHTRRKGIGPKNSQRRRGGDSQEAECWAIKQKEAKNTKTELTFALGLRGLTGLTRKVGFMERVCQAEGAGENLSEGRATMGVFFFREGETKQMKFLTERMKGARGGGQNLNDVASLRTCTEGEFLRMEPTDRRGTSSPQRGRRKAPLIELGGQSLERGN